MTKKINWGRVAGWSVYGLWHCIFVTLALTVLLPYVALPMLNDARIGVMPWHYAMYISLVIIIPFASIAIVYWRFRSQVKSALALFYAVELPLMLLLLLRVMLFRDAPLAAQLLFFNFTVGIFGYFLILWKPDWPNKIWRNGECIDICETAISVVVALVGIYLGLLLGAYFLPILLSFIVDVFSGFGDPSWGLFSFVEGVFESILTLLAIVLFLVTFSFFLVTPFVLIVVYVRQFVRRCRMTSVPRLLAVVGVVLTLEATAFYISYAQPQVRAFELTQELPSKALDQGKLLAQSEEIRRGLIAAYLSPYRFLSTTGESRSVARRYQKMLGKDSIIAEFLQASFNTLAAPFLYRGDSFAKDQLLAEERYQQFFDTPIEKAESEKILAAIKATWENEQNEAGLMNAASHYVLLSNQSIKVEEEGDIAWVTITQTLLNQTYQAQEVVFHFSLPEDAVVTGLWMSDEEGVPEKFKHLVSPRGAAQSVYKSEVRRRIDPALLEKVGPRQYRLRAFPIPARVRERRNGRNRYSEAIRDFTVVPAIVQFQYVVRIDEDGQWPMPELLEKRNVYWAEETIRNHRSDAWLPERLPSLSAQVLQEHTAIINGISLKAIPRNDRKPTVDLAEPIAVIVDGSFSMNQVQDRLAEQLHWLDLNNIAHVLFFCQLACEKVSAQTLRGKVFFGNSQLLEQLAAWTAMESEEYASIFVLTDEGSYELSGDNEVQLNALEKPLWLIHLAEQLPYAYHDTVIDTVNDSRGGVATSFPEAMNMLMWSQKLGQAFDDGQLIGVSDKYFWLQLEGHNHRETQYEEPAFTALAASRWINYLALNSDKSSLEDLDAIHAVAKKFDVVSFFSSMLVLVEDRQRELLKKAEAQDDRFDREVETGKEILAKPMDPFSVPAVPEPEEWALMFIAGILLLLAYVRRRPDVFRRGLSLGLEFVYRRHHQNFSS